MTPRGLLHHLLALQDGRSLVQGYDIGHGHVPHMLVYQAIPSLVSSTLRSGGGPRLSRRLGVVDEPTHVLIPPRTSMTTR